ncbi:MAG TPA: hypothetical protein VL443_06365 [Cyclobacteriaceae bacterium]|jgi:hypothetical protein|nr:hypothetical protein [Cyclobacteriaceae bacterium]
MAFLPLIPQSTDQLSISQGNILNNFTILGAIAGNSNNSSASINNTAGFNWVYLPPQGAMPPAASNFAAGNVALYSANLAATGFNELYVNKTVTGPVVSQIPITACLQGGTNAANGWTYLPSGLKMAWGRATCAAPGLFTVVYATELTNFPGFATQTGSPLVTRISSGTTATSFIYVQTFSNTQFVARTNAAIGGTADFCWFVIGL